MKRSIKYAFFSFAVGIAVPAVALPLGAELPNDPRLPMQWGFEQHNDVDVDIGTAWEMVRDLPRAPVIVAVIDSAMDTSHPDLRNRLWVNQGEIPNNGIDDDGNGYIDDVNGWDFRNDDSSPFDGIIFHATPIAGIIAAEANNGRSSVGIAGDLPVRIMPLQIVNIGDILDGDEAPFEQIARAVFDAVRYAVDNGASIINMSLTLDAPDDPEQEQILHELVQYTADHDVLIVAAAGNQGQMDPRGIPASLDYDNIVSVTSIGRDGTLADHGNWGAGVQIAAPGVGIVSTMPSFDLFDFAMDGTSFAAPFVAGIAAIARSVSPQSTAVEIREALLAGVHHNGLAIETGGYIRAPLVLEQLGFELPGGRDASGAVRRPVAAFDFEIEEGHAPVTLTVDGSASHDATGEVVAWRWDFGDGSRGEGAAATHAYQRGGIFFVRLEVENTNGFVDVSPPVRVRVKAPATDFVRVDLGGEAPMVIAGDLLDGNLEVRTGIFWGRFTRGTGVAEGPLGQPVTVTFETTSSAFNRASGSVTVETGGAVIRRTFSNHPVAYDSLTRTTSMTFSDGPITAWSVSDNN